MYPFNRFSMISMISVLYVLVLLIAPTSFVNAQRKVLLSDDNGWAVAHVRAPYTALKAENYDVGFFSIFFISIGI